MKNQADPVKTRILPENLPEEDLRAQRSHPLPSDLASAHALILAQRELLAKEHSLRIAAESEAKVGALEIEL